MAKINLKPVLMNTAGAAVGGVASNFTGKLPFNSKVSNGVGLIIGAALQALAGKNQMIASVGMGLAGGCTAKLIGELVPSLGEINDNAIDGLYEGQQIGDMNDEALGEVFYDEQEAEEQPTGVAGLSGIGVNEYDYED